jgi:hypothetical protein
MPIETLKGTIRGKLKQPITGYVTKPGVDYSDRKPPPAAGGSDSKAGGGQ